MKAIQWDANICTGCNSCGMICSFIHEQECRPSAARIKMARDAQFGNHVAQYCVQCNEAYCLETCPREALYRDEKSRVVRADTSACRGCAACVATCPVSGIRLVDRETLPCEAACPLGMDIQGYIGLITDGKFAEAYRLIRKTNPLPAVCGRVCFSPCESACKRGYVDSALAVRILKRFVADMSTGEPEMPKITRNGIKVAVIGSGPAGLTAAHDLALLGYEVAVFESLTEPGGMLRVGIPAYRLPKDILSRDIDYIERLGVEIKTGVRVGGEIDLDELKAAYKAIFIATGAHDSLKLGIPGEEAPGVFHGVELLRKVNLGEKVELGKKVIVVGGGNVAIDAARVSRRLGAHQVTLVCLERREEMPAFKAEVEQALAEGISLMTSWGVSRIIGDAVLEGMELMRCTAVFDSRGRFAPTFDRSMKTTVKADTIIPAIGQSSRPPLSLKNFTVVSNGSASIAFNNGGILAAGDVIKPSTVVEAMAAGRQAAKSIHCYIRGVPVASTIKSREKPAPLSDRDISELRSKWSAQPRVEATKLSPLTGAKGFTEVELSYSRSQAQEEARRCACQAGTIFKCDFCGDDPECVKWCSAEALTIKDVDSVSLPK